jgi:hypothetical protein
MVCDSVLRSAALLVLTLVTCGRPFAMAQAADCPHLLLSLLPLLLQVVMV